MKKISIYLILASVVLFSCNNSTTEKKDVKLTNENDSISYALGVDIANSLKKSGLDSINVNAFVKALKSAYDSSELLIAETDAQMFIQKYFAAQQQKQRAKDQEKFKKNIKIGEDFLAENAKKEGVVTTSSGLQYKIIKKGTGATPTATSVVTVDYEGKLVDGKVFDSSYKTGKPATFPVNGVIPGWTEALQLMKEGAVWELYIPQELAYGANSPGGVIEPYSTLVFKVELKKVQSAAK